VVLFFSSAREAVPGDPPGDHDIYMSRFERGAFGAAELVEGVNTEFQDGQPNVRRDGRELFFYSDRPGSEGNDIYSTSRALASHPWSTPVNMGPNVNSSGSETRPSLSWDGRSLYFGSTRAGSSDIYVTRR
jgi:Tol biopolymer transport system component